MPATPVTCISMLATPAPENHRADTRTCGTASTVPGLGSDGGLDAGRLRAQGGITGAIARNASGKVLKHRLREAVAREQATAS